MRTITDHIRSKLYNDLIAYEALRRGMLNLRAYARSIRPAIEASRHEKVDVATMAVALSRLEKELHQQDALLPNVHLEDLTTQSPLFELTYPKDSVSLQHLDTISAHLSQHSTDFVVVTQGFREVTIIMPSRYLRKVRSAINATPIYIKTDLSAVSMHFSAEYLETPNVIYTILGQLAVHRINIIEVVSTSTELSVVVKRELVETVTEALHRLF